MPNEREYVLGSTDDEIERLRFQHNAWVLETHELWRRAGIRIGHTVIDLGCGPGFTSMELSGFVGASGRVVARDQSDRFIGLLREECARRSIAHVEATVERAEDFELAGGMAQVGYSRWLFCWVREPRDVLARLSRAVERGGVIALQEYLDWGAMRLIPESEVFARVVSACMESWHESGANIDVGRMIPGLAKQCKLELVHFRPIARAGTVGSIEWRWLEQFFKSYLPKVASAGILKQEEMAEFARVWGQRAKNGESYCCTPTLVEILLQVS